MIYCSYLFGSMYFPVGIPSCWLTKKSTTCPCWLSAVSWSVTSVLQLQIS
jgi:ABC-type Fe3+-siderophore transport system, permease component